MISTDWKPVFEIVFSKLRNKEQRTNQKIIFDEFISVKGIKAQGNQLTPHKVKQVNILEPIEFIPPIEKSANEMVLRIKNETKIKNVKINKLSSTNYRVFLGPFRNLSSLKKHFNAINTLQFDNIEVIKK